jgi:hypothetical protein
MRSLIQGSQWQRCFGEWERSPQALATAVMCCCSRVRGTGVDATCVVELGGEVGLVVMFGETATGAEVIVGRGRGGRERLGMAE